MIVLTLRTVADGELEIGIKTSCEEIDDPGAFETMYRILAYLKEEGIIESDTPMRIH
jgi:hypothetical protein